MTAHWTTKLEEMNACAESVKWAQDYDTFKEAWDACERGDWMMWILVEMDALSEDPSVTLACKFAQRVMPLADAPQSHAAIEAAERWLNGPPTKDRRKAAAEAAYWAAVEAAEAAAEAAYWAAVEAAEAAAEAAYWAAGAAAEAAAKAVELKAQADIIRASIPMPTLLEADA